MNPSDLLLTNKIVSDSTSFCRQDEPSLEHLNNVKGDREHQELKEYLKGELYNCHKKPQKKGKYAGRYNASFDVLEPPIRNPGITANLDRPQWIFDKQNISLSSSVRPVFDNMIGDLKKFRYRKHIISYINIDSRQRDVRKYPNPGSYNIFLNKEFRYLQSIRLESVEFREAPTPINSSNNCFIWITNYTGLNGIKPGTRVKYHTTIPSAFYSLANFVQVIETESINRVTHDIPEDCITGDDTVNGKFPNFDIYISPFNRSIQFIQRLENLCVSCIFTTKCSNVVEIRVANNNIKEKGADPIPPPNLNCGEGFPFRPDLEEVPIILSGLELFATSFGNIPTSFLSLQTFYPETALPIEDPCVLNPFNKYSCQGYDATNHEFIYNLHVFAPDGTPAVASVDSFTELNDTKLPNFPAGHSVKVQVGRALRFEVVTSCGGTFGEFLGLVTSDQDVFLNTNIDFKTGVVRNTIPWKVTGTGELSIATNEYILMRIGTKAKPIGTISNNLTCAKGNANPDITDKKDNFFFAKIIFSDKLPGDISILSAGGNKFFYDAPLVSLSDLTVDFFDSSGKVLELNQNHSFTLEIIELREVLKDTLIDSRTGNIADIGADVTTTNPI